MIKTLSSYYLTIPLVSPLTGLTAESVELKLYVWNGDKTAPPITETYKLTEPNPEALTNSINVNIARLINDFIDFEPQVLTNNLQDGNNQVWVKSELYYNTEDETESLLPQNTLIQLALKGYGFALEGINPQTPTDKLLLTSREFKVSRNSKFIVPVIAEETPPITTPNINILNLTNVGGLFYTLEFNLVGNYTELFPIVTPAGGLPETLPSVLPVSPKIIKIDYTGIVSVEIVGFDLDTSQNIVSNTFNINI